MFWCTRSNDFIADLQVSDFVSALARVVVGAVLLLYEAAVAAIIAFVPSVPGLRPTLRFADAAFG